jgi:hypothetical protein
LSICGKHKKLGKNQILWQKVLTILNACGRVHGIRIFFAEDSRKKMWEIIRVSKERNLIMTSQESNMYVEVSGQLSTLDAGINPTSNVESGFNPEEGRRFERIRRAFRRIFGPFALAGLLAHGAVACSSAEQEESVSTGTEAPTSAFDQTPRSMSDQELATAGYNCGNGLKMYDASVNAFDFGPMVEFYNENPDTAQELRSLNVNNAEYGMGQEAWDFANNRGLVNSNTELISDIDSDIASSEELEAHVERMVRVEVSESFQMINFTCDGGVREVGVVNVNGDGNKNALNGYMFTPENYAEWESLANNVDRFKVINLTIEDENYYFVTMYLDGCTNPTRVPDAPTPDAPTTVVSTPPSMPPITATIPPTPTPTTTVPDKVPTTVIPEDDTTAGPGAGGQPGGPGTTSTTRPTPTTTQPNTPTTPTTGPPRPPAPPTPPTTGEVAPPSTITTMPPRPID